MENQCPTCHGPISEEDRNLHMERFVAQANLPCKWAPASDVDEGEGGCEFEGPKDVRLAHEQVCEFGRWACKWAGDVGGLEGRCDFQGNRDACSKHEQVCEFRR